MTNYQFPAIESSSVSTLTHVSEMSEDPTALTVEFNVVGGVRGDPGATWVAGSWQGVWSERTGWVAAKTPTIGATGSDFETDPGDYHLFQRVDGERILYCGLFRVN